MYNYLNHELIFSFSAALGQPRPQGASEHWNDLNHELIFFRCTRPASTSRVFRTLQVYNYLNHFSTAEEVEFIIVHIYNLPKPLVGDAGLAQR